MTALKRQIGDSRVRLFLGSVLGLFLTASAGDLPVPLSRAADRVRTPLRVEMRRIGTLQPRAVSEIHGSNWTLGCETLDRGFANFDAYKDYLAPLGIKTIRLQGG